MFIHILVTRRLRVLSLIRTVLNFLKDITIEISLKPSRTSLSAVSKLILGMASAALISAKIIMLLVPMAAYELRKLINLRYEKGLRL